MCTDHNSANQSESVLFHLIRSIHLCILSGTLSINKSGLQFSSTNGTMTFAPSVVVLFFPPRIEFYSFLSLLSYVALVLVGSGPVALGLGFERRRGR